MYNRNSPQQGGKKLRGKLRPRITGFATDPGHLQHSQSWDSSLGLGEVVNNDYIMDGEGDLPEPPTLPSIEYLLGKRPVNLRKRTVQTLKEQIKERAANMRNTDDSYDSDSHSSVGSSQSDQYKRHRRKRKKRKSARNTTNIEEEEGAVLQNSPSRVLRASPGLERFPTPFPSFIGNTRFAERMPLQQKIDFDSAFDEVTNELEALANSPPSFTPVGLSSISSVRSSPAPNLIDGKSSHSTQKPPLSHASSVQRDISAGQTTQKSSKRGGPKLLPHQKSKQEPHAKHHAMSNVSSSALEPQKQKVLRRFFGTKKHKMKQSDPPALIKSGKDATSLASDDPVQFINILSQAIKSSPKQPRFLKQASSQSIQPESAPMDIDEIELQLSEMKLMLESAAGSTTSNSIRPPSPEFVRTSAETSDTESDSTEYTSSSDEDTETSDTDDTSSEDSSNEGQRKKASGQRRPIMARNIGMGDHPRTRGFGFNRARMLSRYPRLLGRTVIYLDTIEEASEEIIYLTVSFINLKYDTEGRR